MLLCEDGQAIGAIILGIGLVPHLARRRSDRADRSCSTESTARDHGPSAPDRGASGFDGAALWATLCATASAVRTVWPVWTTTSGAPGSADASDSRHPADPA